MEGAEFDALVEDIKTHGLQQKLVMYQGKILDGRNRWRACEALGIKPKWVDYEGDDPLGHVLSLNLHRRHLDASQRAMVGARIATLKNGQRPSAIAEGATQGQAAKQLNVSTDSVGRAREVVEHGTPALVAAVDRGDVAVSVASKIARAPKKVQREAAENPKNAPAIAKRIEEEKREEKSEEPPIELHGLDVPADVLAAAEKEQSLIAKMDHLIRELKKTYTEYEEHRGSRVGLKAGQYQATALRDALAAFGTIRQCRPASVCLNCKLWPDIRKTCPTCRGTGYMDERTHKDMDATGGNPLLLEGDEAGVWVNGKWQTLISLRGEDF
jgi:ParB-like chromosome segregation protein Spo0J